MSIGKEQVVTGLVVNCCLRPTNAYFDSVAESIDDAACWGVEKAAAYQGLTVGQLQSRLNGQVNYILRFNVKRGTLLKGRLYSLWNAAAAQERSVAEQG